MMIDEQKVRELKALHKKQSDGYADYLAHGGKADETEEAWLGFLFETIISLDNQQEEIARLKNELLMAKKKNDEPIIDVSDDFFGAILNCAVRYSLGRQSYMPRLVVDYITPLVPQLSDKTLWCFAKDIAEQKRLGYGDPMIYEPMWMRFLSAVREEQERRTGNKKEASLYDCSK